VGDPSGTARKRYWVRDAIGVGQDSEHLAQAWYHADAADTVVRRLAPAALTRQTHPAGRVADPRHCSEKRTQNATQERSALIPVKKTPAIFATHEAS